MCIWLPLWSRTNQLGKYTGFIITLSVPVLHLVSMSVRQGLKRCVQSAKANDLTVGDWTINLFSWIVAFPWSIIMPWDVIILDIIKCKLYVASVIYLTSLCWVVMYFNVEWTQMKCKLYIDSSGWWSHCVDNILYYSTWLHAFLQAEVISV